MKKIILLIGISLLSVGTATAQIHRVAEMNHAQIRALNKSSLFDGKNHKKTRNVCGGKLAIFLCDFRVFA